VHYGQQRKAISTGKNVKDRITLTNNLQQSQEKRDSNPTERKYHGKAFQI
jgi:hypothetical protein